MRRFRRSSFVRSFFLPFSLTIWLAACHKWVQLRPPPVELPAQASTPVENRDEQRLHLDPSGTVEGTLAELTQDSVVLVDEEARVAVPVESVSRVDARRSDTVATVALVVVSTAVTLGVGLLVAIAIACHDGRCD